jgi:hypothetical protein
VGLGKLIVGYDKRTKEKKGKIRISSEGVHFSNDFKKRIEEALKEMAQRDSNKKHLPSSKEAMRDEVNELVLQNTSGEARHFLSQVILNKRGFDLNRSIASITGYLGEIRAAALLMHLQVNEDLANKYSIKATGALRNNKTRQEIPIDLVCAGAGF